MFTRALLRSARVLKPKAVLTGPVRNFGAHGPAPHVRGTRESDYILERDHGVIIPPPGTLRKKPFAAILCTIVGAFSFYILAEMYQDTRPIRFEVKKVQVKDPLTGEDLIFFKPFNIIAREKSIYGYTMVMKPAETKRAKVAQVTQKMQEFNSEMDTFVNMRTIYEYEREHQMHHLSFEEYYNKTVASFSLFFPKKAAHKPFNEKDFITSTR